jgi:ribosomal-protein-alanine N-acetyltransferase
MGIVICRIEPADVPYLAKMESYSSACAWSEGSLKGSVEAGDGCYKLVVGRKACGYCVIRVCGVEMEILNLVVDKSRQRMGYGRYLLEGILKLFEYTMVEKFWLEVAADNQQARALYRSLGFIVAGTRPDYYVRNARRSDATVMVLERNTAVSG